MSKWFKINLQKIFITDRFFYISYSEDYNLSYFYYLSYILTFQLKITLLNFQILAIVLTYSSLDSYPIVTFLHLMLFFIYLIS